jgi:ribosome recycling factor
MAEEARVSLRHARKAGNDETKNDLKAGEIGEDEGRDFLGRIQKMTDGYTDKIDELLEKKEKELMAI